MKKATVNIEMGNVAGGQTSSNTPLSPPSVESLIPGPCFHIPNPNMVQSQSQMPIPPPPIPTNFSSGGGNVNTFFAPRTQPGAQLSLDGMGWKKMSISKQGRPLLTFGTILTPLSTVPEALIGSL